MSKFNVQIEDSEGNQYYPKPDLLTTKEQVAANNAAGKSVDALVVKELNNKLNLQPEWIQDASGKITGYRIGGADTVFPFSQCVKVTCNVKIELWNPNKSNGIHAKNYSGYIIVYGTKHIINMDNSGYNQTFSYEATITARVRVSTTVTNIEIVDPSDYF